MKKAASSLRISARRAWLAALAASALLGGCHVRSEAETDTAAAAAAAVTTPGGIEMVALGGGWFSMGSSDAEESDEPLHQVFVSPFCIDKYPVTQAEYAARMGGNPSHWTGPDRPVEQIRWRQAAAYCNARSQSEGLQSVYDPRTWECNFDADGYRLPTEAEYEYALRAGSSTSYFFGDSPGDLPRYAWFKENSPRGSHAVGQKPPNGWGLHDMVGNVWEWCNDYYHEDYYRQSAQRDPRGPRGGENRVVRGGGWNSKPDHCRSAYRYYEMPAYTDICFAKDIHGQIGFRCVRKR
jgi:formylglycine-generating enzyme required for sulfatase activity